MRLTKKEFIEVYDDVKSAIAEVDKMQKAITILCPDSYPVLKDPYENIYFKLLKKLMGDEYIEECFYGECTKGWIKGEDGEKEYDLTNPDSYYDWLVDTGKNNSEKAEEK